MLTTTRFAARFFAAAVPAAAIAVLGFAGTAEAAAPAVKCGASLTVNSALTANLSCAAGNGITLGKGVVLNLGGFSLVGPGASGTAVTFSPDGGSSVINGTIRGWALGVDADSEDAVSSPVPTGKITKVTLDKAPVSAYYSVLTVADSTLTGSPLQLSEATFTSTATKFITSSVNGWASRISLSGATVIGGSVDNSYAFGVKIDKSSLDGTGFTGAPATCSETDITLTNSTVKNYTAPISGYYCTVNLSGNTFSANKNGVLGDVTDGMGGSAVSATITNNKFSTSGVVLDNGAMKVVGNTFTNNITGIIAENPKYTTVTGNTFSGNTSSGLRAIGSGISVGTNKATTNGRYGINAPGAVDLGGNTASGNPLGNCIGLVCAKA